MRRLALLCLPLLLVACGSKTPAPPPLPTTSTSSTTLTQTTTTTALATTSTTNPITRCHTPALTLAQQGSEGAAGTIYLTFSLTASAPCTLTGYPGAALVFGGTEVVKNTTRDTSKAVTVVSLSPGASAYFTLSYSDVQSTSTACLSADTLLVTPPDETTQLSVPVDLSQVCSTTVGITPVRKTA